MNKYLLALIMLLMTIAITVAQDDNITYTTTDNALILTAPEGYVLDVVDIEERQANAEQFGFSIDPASTPLEVTLEPTNSMTSLIQLNIFYGQPLDTFFGSFIGASLDEPIIPSEADPAIVLEAIGTAFTDPESEEEIAIQTLMLDDGTEIVFYDFVSSVSDEELGGIDMGEAMGDVFGNAGIETDDDTSSATDALGEMFGSVENPFGDGLFDSLSETTRYYGLTFDNTGTVIIEVNIGSTIEGESGVADNVQSFMDSLDGDIPVVTDAFVNLVEAGTGDPIYIEATPVPDDNAPSGQQSSGEFSYTPPPNYAVIATSEGEVILSDNPAADPNLDVPPAGEVRIVIQYGQPLAESLNEGGISMSEDITVIASQLGNLLGTTPVPTTIGATETLNITFDAGMFSGQYYLFAHPTVGPVFVAATADAETLAAAQRDLIVLIVSMQS